MSKSQPLKSDERIARIIHDLAVTPPAKSVAEVKAASDVLEANAPQAPEEVGETGSERSLKDGERKKD